MQIRLAQKKELNILEQLARQIWPSTYAQIISEAQIEFMLNWMYSARTLEKQLDEGHEFYIHSSEGRDTGFLAIEWVQNPTKNQGRELKINKLYVLDECQGKGIGSALINRAIQRARETNCQTIFLQVNKANKAKNFYLQLDFKVREAAVFDIGNGFVMDDYIMELPL